MIGVKTLIELSIRARYLFKAVFQCSICNPAGVLTYDLYILQNRFIVKIIPQYLKLNSAQLYALLWEPNLKMFPCSLAGLFDNYHSNCSHQKTPFDQMESISHGKYHKLENILT